MNACKIMAKDLVRTRRYIQKFHSMKTQLQAVSLRMQTLRSNQQMAEAMRGATRAMASMNRGLNLPGIQRIMREFEKESSMMDMKEEMMSDAVDVLDDEDEEEQEDEILKEVLDELDISISQQVCYSPQPTDILFNTIQLTEAPTGIAAISSPLVNRQPVALGAHSGQAASAEKHSDAADPHAGMSDEDALQARLDALRRS
ncbi:hypothetical protein AX16_004234 [Volvariella volvacea WC 439]|nr:hypothetical protein AX16_004234 [Volvariella volvacea WC 439]